MKIFYAVGDKLCTVPVLLHPEQSRTSKNCSFFPLCPTVHLGTISEELLQNNFKACEGFTLFESIEDAYKCAFEKRFSHSHGGPHLFLTFKVQVEESLLPKTEERGTYYNVSPDRISQLVEALVDQQALFGNTEPEYLESKCTIL